jgi:hypothetical protein
VGNEMREQLNIFGIVSAKVRVPASQLCVRCK